MELILKRYTLKSSEIIYNFCPRVNYRNPTYS